jgi:hypothetical protein
MPYSNKNQSGNQGLSDLLGLVDDSVRLRRNGKGEGTTPTGNQEQTKNGTTTGSRPVGGELV